MSEDNGENILSHELEYVTLSLLAHKIRILVVGGGRAGFTKAYTYAKKGCSITILSPNFSEKFHELCRFPNVNMIHDFYEIKYILDKHLIIIATDNEEINNLIKEHCEAYAKIYLYCSDFKQGNFINSVQRETDNIIASVNTRKGSPKLAVMLADIVKSTLEPYDGYVDYLCRLREEIKSMQEKDNMLSFIHSQDFYFFYKEGYADLILSLFYDEV